MSNRLSRRSSARFSHILAYSSLILIKHAGHLLPNITRQQASALPKKLQATTSKKPTQFWNYIYNEPNKLHAYCSLSSLMQLCPIFNQLNKHHCKSAVTAAASRLLILCSRVENGRAPSNSYNVREKKEKKRRMKGTIPENKRSSAPCQWKLKDKSRLKKKQTSSAK